MAELSRSVQGEVRDVIDERDLDASALFYTESEPFQDAYAHYVELNAARRR